jgi:hypothetical protein
LYFNEAEEQMLSALLDRLSEKKISWETFLEKIDNPLSVSRFRVTGSERSLLHLAVLDNRLDVVELLSRDPVLNTKPDVFGLSPLELAQFLGRKDLLLHLQTVSKTPPLPALPKLEGFEYLTHPIFETAESLECILNQVAKAKREDKIPGEKIWMGVYFDKELRKGLHPPISIRHVSNEIGFGVFAEKKIPPCSFVGEYTGEILERKPRQLKDKRHCLRYTVWEGKKNFTLDAEKKGNFTRFINHSAQPNLCLQSVYWRGIPRMIFVALKEIQQGAQLVFDYGPLFWKESRQTPKPIHEN